MLSYVVVTFGFAAADADGMPVVLAVYEPPPADRVAVG